MIIITPRPLKVLIVADNYAKVDSLKRTLFDNKILHTIAVTMDSVETMEFLNYSSKKPDILVTDDSHVEVLNALKESEFRKIPLVVTHDKNTYERKGNVFFLKPPVSAEQLFDIMEKLPVLYFVAVDEEDIEDA